MKEHVPPHNLEAEMCFLGSVMLGGKKAGKLAQLVEPEEFYRPAHCTMLDAIRRIARRGESVDLVTVKHELDAAGKLESVGGVGMLIEVAEAVPSVANAKDYAAIVKRLAYRRGKIDGLRNALELAYGEGDIADVDQAISGLARRPYSGEKELFAPADCVGSAPEALDTFIPGIKLEVAQTFVLQAETGQGKTLLAQDIAMDQVRRGRRVFFALVADLSRFQFVSRIMVKETGWDRRPDYESEVQRAWDEAEAYWCDEFGGVSDQFVIYDALERGGGTRMSDIRAAIYQAHEKAPLDLAIVDYFQVIEPDNPTGKDHLDNRGNSKALIQIAKDLNIPVGVTSQVTRQDGGKPYKYPPVKPMGGRGVEQDAGLVLTTYWQDMAEDKKGNPVELWDLERPEGGEVARLVISKCRFKRPKAPTLKYDETKARFTTYNDAK